LLSVFKESERLEKHPGLKLLAVKQTEKERVSESFLVALLTQNRERIEGKKEE